MGRGSITVKNSIFVLEFATHDPTTHTYRIGHDGPYPCPSCAEQRMLPD